MSGEQDEGDTETGEEQSQTQPQPHPFANRRMGSTPGPGPKGAELSSFDELPDDVNALKGMYIELEKAYQDKLAETAQDNLFSGPDWMPQPMVNETTTEDILNHFWNRGMEIIFVAGVLITVMSLLSPEISLTQPSVIVLTLLAAWERYLRGPVNIVGGAITNWIERTTRSS